MQGLDVLLLVLELSWVAMLCCIVPCRCITSSKQAEAGLAKGFALNLSLAHKVWTYFMDLEFRGAGWQVLGWI